MNSFKNMDRATLQQDIRFEEALLTLLESKYKNKYLSDESFEEKVHYLTDNISTLKEIILSYLYLLKAANSSGYNAQFNERNILPVRRYVKEAFTFKTYYPDESIEGLTTYELFNNLGLIPFNIYLDTIYELNLALDLLDIYGENTLPKKVLSFLKNKVTSHNYEDDNVVFDFENYLEEWIFSPLAVPPYEFSKNSLTEHQVSFFLKSNNSYMYHWYTCHISSEIVSDFLKKYINNKEKINSLFSNIRTILEASATNLATISNFTIITGKVYYLECLIYVHEFEIPDLVYSNYQDISYLSKTIIDLNNLLFTQG